jgi:hypothetical protein
MLWRCPAGGHRGAGLYRRVETPQLGCFASLPGSARDLLPARLVETLEPIGQDHTIEGLVMGEP